MLAGYLTGILLCLSALIVGQAAMTLCGRKEPSALAPAIGLALLLIAADLSIRLPGRDDTATITLALLTLGGVWVLLLGPLKTVQGGSEEEYPRTAAVSAGLGALMAGLAASIPFLATGRMGPLGQGLVNDDMASHLLFTEWIADPLGREPDLVTGGYPLAPHSLVAAVANGTGSSYVEVFGGLTIALAALAALTAYGALEVARPWVRGPAAALAALPYLGAAWLAQGAFKEPMLALFIVAFALSLRDVDRSAGRAIPPALIAAGALYAYSFPGLTWLIGTLGVWALLELAKGRGEGKLDLRTAARVAVRPAAWAAGLLVLVALPQLGRMKDFASFGAFDPEGVGPKVGFGNLRQALNPLEGLNVWPASDFRVTADAASLPTPAFYLGGLLGAVALGWALAVAWRRRETVLPAALAACVVMYAAAKIGGTPYTSAKALAIGSPALMVLVLRGLLATDPAALLPRIAPLRIPLAAVFIAGAVASSFLPLRAGAVGPENHAKELMSLRGIVGKGPVLYLGRDQFAAPDLYHARLGTPVLNHYNVKGLPSRFPSTDEFVKLDWDALTSAQLDEYPFAITVRTPFLSQAPKNWHQRAATDDYILWQREGPTPPRETLQEPDQPGALLDCAAGVPRGAASVFAAPPVIGPSDAWSPSERVTDSSPARQSLTLTPGHWEISLEYVSTQPLRVTADGFDRTLPANLDFRGPAPAFASGGEIEVKAPGPIPFEVSVEPPPFFGRLIGAESVAFPLRIVATAPGIREELPAGQACGRYVDFLTPG